MEPTLLLKSSSFPYLSSNVYFIACHGLKIIFDTGNFFMREKLQQALETHDIDPASIDVVVNSHLHYDHCGNNALFCHSHILAPKKEINFIEYISNTPEAELFDLFENLYKGFSKRKIKSYTRLFIANSNATDWFLQNSQKVTTVSGDCALSPQVSIKVMNGSHSPGHLCLFIRHHETVSVFAGDLFVNTDETTDWYSSSDYLITNQSMLMQHRNKILEEAQIIYPGHGSIIRQSIPT